MSFQISSQIYGSLIRLYPDDLQREFGPEMRSIFSEDLADARRARGLAGAIGVWWCAVCEVLRIALPGLRSNPKFTVPALAFAFNVLSLGGELAGVMTHSHELVPHGQLLIEEVGRIVIFPSLVVAATAIVVVHTGKVDVQTLSLKSM